MVEKKTEKKVEEVKQTAKAKQVSKPYMFKRN